MSHWKPVKLDHEETVKFHTARAALVVAAPFWAHLMYDRAEIIHSRELPTAATDGTRRIWINPDYVYVLPIEKQVFIFAHEIAHMMFDHCGRAFIYLKDKNLDGLEFSTFLWNIATDAVINDLLIATKVGTYDPKWVHMPDMIKHTDMSEEGYKRLYKKFPPPKDGKGKPGAGQPGEDDPNGQSMGSASHGGKQGFDEHVLPEADVDGNRGDERNETEWQQAVASAAETAKSMGKLPAEMQRMVDAILEPQVDWRNKLRLTVTRQIGDDDTSLARPNRRKLAFSIGGHQMIYPGNIGFGAGVIAVGLDTSGSMGDAEFKAALGELQGILQDARPQLVVVLQCDADVADADELADVSELDAYAAKGMKGGGGTSFVPVFDWLEENQITPQALIYITDMMGTFPDEAPGYPVIWVASTDTEGPFGETIKVEV